jgi:thioesterase domain-containing protein
VFAFKSRGLDGQKEFETIEEMAAQYVADLRARQPRGPYCLGGYCFGGNVAYEMARQIHAQGERVALLALLNCTPSHSSYTRVALTPAWLLKFLKNLAYLAGCFFQWSPELRRQFVAWKLRNLLRKITRCFGVVRAASMLDANELIDLSGFPAEQRTLWETHIRELLRHQTRPYGGGRMTLFRSRGHQLLCSFDEAYGWSKLALSGVTIRVVPGAHESILDEPHVRTLAEELKRSLQEITDNKPEAPNT